MPAIVTNDIRFNGSDNFISSVKNVNQMIYLFIGKDQSASQGQWAMPSDAPTPEKNHSRFLEDSYDINYMTRVYYSNLSRIMRHVVWAPTTSYDMYDDKQDMSGANTAVVSSNNVYKCLDNSNVSNTGTSVTDPALHAHATTTNGVISTSDGYIWKYMYTIPNGTDSGSLDWFPLIETSVANWIGMDTVSSSEECPSQWDVRKNVVSGGVHAFRYTFPSNVNPQTVLPDDSVVHLYTGTGVDGEGFVGSVEWYTDTSNIPRIRIVCDPRNNSATKPGSDYTKIESVRVTPPGGSMSNEYIIPDTDPVETVPYSDYIYPIFSPSDGHGFNPVRELNGFYILVTANVSGVSTDYRKVGLISNPLRKTRTDGELNKPDYIKDDEVIFGEKIGKEFVIANTEYLRGTGEILYIENKINDDAETISTDGSKQIKLILSF